MLATLLALILTVLSAALPVGAEQPATRPTVGWLGPNPETGPHRGFRSGLRELGYSEGQNVAIEYRFPEGKVERYAGQIEELGRLSGGGIELQASVTAAVAREPSSTIER